jgi:hypothetical protein
MIIDVWQTPSCISKPRAILGALAFCNGFRLPLRATIHLLPSEVLLNEEDGTKFPFTVNLHNAVAVSRQRWGNVRFN